MSKKSDDFDVILNKQNVAQARAQKVVQSWLGPLADGAKLWEANDEREDDSEPEAENLHLGVGAQAPLADKDIGFGLKRTSRGVNDQLLEQILGKQGAKQHRAKVALKSKPMALQSQSGAVASAPATTQAGNVLADSEDEGGRASTIRTKSARKRGALDSQTIEVREESHSVSSGPQSDLKGSQKPRVRSYLDQMLAEKHGKKKRKLKP